MNDMCSANRQPSLRDCHIFKGVEFPAMNRWARFILSLRDMEYALTAISLNRWAKFIPSLQDCDQADSDNFPAMNRWVKFILSLRDTENALTAISLNRCMVNKRRERNKR